MFVSLVLELFITYKIQLIKNVLIYFLSIVFTYPKSQLEQYILHVVICMILNINSHISEVIYVFNTIDIKYTWNMYCHS